MLLTAADAVHRVEASQDELDARGADRRLAAGIDLKGFVPGGRDSLQTLSVVGRRKHIPDFHLHAPAENLRNLRQTVLFDLFMEDHADRLGDNGIEHLPLAHLMASHQI